MHCVACTDENKPELSHILDLIDASCIRRGFSSVSGPSYVVVPVMNLSHFRFMSDPSCLVRHSFVGAKASFASRFLILSASARALSGAQIYFTSYCVIPLYARASWNSAS